MQEVTKRFLAAKAFIQNEQGEVLILREGNSYQEGTNLRKWDVPGGRLEPGETLLEGLAREVGEESGLTVTVERLLDARENFPVIKDEKVHIVRLYYLCQCTEGNVTLSTDHDTFAWITKEEASSYSLMDDVKDLIQKL